MEKIHPLSETITLPEFDLFTVPYTQETIVRNIITEHNPISTLQPNSLIEFVINPSIDEYIQLKDTMLYMRIKVNISKHAGTIAESDWKKIQPVNNLLHSMFKTIDLEIEGKSITLSPQTYAYKAYFETYLGYTGDCKVGYLSAQGYSDADENDKANIVEKMSQLIRPNPVTADGKGKYIELMGKLHLDMSFQPRPLLGGTKIKITLVPNDPSFYMWNKDNSLVVDVEFDKAKLFLARSKVAYEVVEAHNLSLMKGSAKYPLMRGYVKSFTVQKDSIEANIDNAVTGQLPRRIFMGMVSNKAFNGILAENPFQFKNFNLSYLTTTVDGVQYPTVAYTPDFSKDLCTREFLSVYEALNQLTTDTTLTLDRKEYINGNTLFGFNYGQDPTDDCNKVGYVNLQKKGSVNIHMKFSQALSETINVIVYCEYDNLLQIDATRHTHADYL